MIRKSALAISLMLLAAPLRLGALGLGEIDMVSALNQPMKATIDLTSAAGVDLSEVKIGLASLEAHERLGLTKDKILSMFKFAVAKDSRGKPIITVSSNEPVREPYLEFLLEMEWESGRMVREYTVLVDPPVTMAAAPVEPAAPVAKAPAIVPAVTAPVARTAAAPRPPVTTYAPAPARERAGNTYGAVRRDESLWSIAKRLRPDSAVSIQQMMLALLKANPQAFPDNNINNMKAGSILTIPRRDEVLEMSMQEARAEAGRQYNEWLEQRESGRSSVVQAASPRESIDDRVDEAELEAQASLPDAVMFSDSDAQLKLTPPEGMPDAGSATSTSDSEASANQSAVEEGLRQQLVLAAEEVEASRAESDELRSRVLELEEQINKMQRLLELKSDALAGLQQQVGIEPDAITDTVAGLDAGDAMAPADVTETMTAVAEEAASEVASSAELAAEKGAGAVAGLTAKARGIVDKLMDNPILAGIGALVAILLGGFIWGSSRKHAGEGLDDAPDVQHGDAFGAADTYAQATPEDDASDRSESTGMDDAEVDLQEPETVESNDPITEADVYLAYGRVHQAEDVLQAAMQSDPDNLPVRAKLLEVFHAAGNVAAFNKAAAEYRELQPQQDAQWDHIATLGYELSPGNELYSSSQQGAGDAGNTGDFDMDLSGMDELASADNLLADTEDLTLDIEAAPDKSDEVAEALEFTLDDADETVNQGEGLLASADEVATKLDLARAYIDMEDPEGARSILQEVIKEGSAEQISEAEQLISQIV